MKNPLGRITVGTYTLVSMVAVLCCPFGAFASSILGLSQSFAVLGGSAVTNTGTSTISGDLGVYSGNSITSFPPGIVYNGISYAGGAVAQQAQNDEYTAYQTLAVLPVTSYLTGDLGGHTLDPGVYNFSTSAQLTGTLTLDFENESDAQFVFQIGSALTTASLSSVNVLRGNASDSIFWQVGSSATLGTGTAFAGNILALTSITMDTAAKIECGRAFAYNGAVTLDSNVISNDCGLYNTATGYSTTGPTDFGSYGFSASPTLGTPEPGTFLLMGIGLAAFVLKYSARKE